MVAAGEARSHGFSGAVLQHGAVVVEKERVSDRRFHAHARRAAGDDEMGDAQSREELVEFGLVEGAEPRLPHDDVAISRSELVEDLRRPRVALEDAVLEAEVTEE